MPWNGSGQFNRDTGVFTGATVWDDSRLAARTVRSDDNDTHDEDIATGLENTVTRDGQNSPSANLPMGGFRHTGVDDAAARTDYAAAGQIQDQGLTHLPPASVTGNPAILLTPTPAITTYVAGQRFSFVVEATNTGAITVTVSGLAAKALEKLGTALVAGDITVDDLIEIEYDGTQFQMLTPARTPVLTDSSIPASKLSGVGITLDTKQASTSGNAVTFTGIPSGVKRITFMMEGVSTNGTNQYILQIGDSGGIEATGYASGANGSSSTVAFILTIGPAATHLYHGTIILNLVDASTFTWTSQGSIVELITPLVISNAGSKSLSAELTQIQLGTVGFVDTFDAGNINIAYE